MNPRYLGAVIVSVGLWGAAGEARGDVGPPPDYADPCDSVVLDASCRRCTVPEFKAPECHASAREVGLTPRCSGWGYTMYCGEPSAQPQPQPQPPPPVIAEPPAPNPWPAVPAETPGPVAIAAAPERAGAESAIAARQGSEPAPAVAEKRSGCAIVSRHGDPSLLVWLGLGLGLGLGLRRRRRPAA